MLDERLHAVNMPAEWGGQGLTCLEQVLSQEQLGRSTNALWDVVWRPANVLRHCNDEQRERYLLPEIQGRRRYAYAITEPDAGSDTSRLRTSATRDGDAYVIDGEKWFVTSGDAADYIIVHALVDGEPARPTLFLVDSDAPGVRVLREPKFTHTYRLRAPRAALRAASRSAPSTCWAASARASSSPRTGSSRRGCRSPPTASAAAIRAFELANDWAPSRVAVRRSRSAATRRSSSCSRTWRSRSWPPRRA